MREIVPSIPKIDKSATFMKRFCLSVGLLISGVLVGGIGIAMILSPEASEEIMSTIPFFESEAMKDSVLFPLGIVAAIAGSVLVVIGLYTMPKVNYPPSSIMR